MSVTKTQSAEEIQVKNGTLSAAETTPNVQAERPWVRPAVDILEGESGLLLVADLPGVSRDTVSLTVERQQLTLEGRWAVPDEGTPLTTEGTPVNYRRTLRLPDGLDLSAVTARMEAGVLHIHLPLSVEAKPRQIQVQGLN